MSNDSSQKSIVHRRSPIVVVMGHVDHGKTTLLDHIRKTKVASREAGGITQSVGAYEIVWNGQKITFIDTPGHEAFGAMRARGAQVADLAILVIAADEGIKPQTREAIKILKETGTPFVVAINKIDKTGGAIEKAKNDLMQEGVFLEGFGGQISFQGISAKTGEGVDALLELVLLSADMEDLSFDPAAPASGYILEARLNPRRGIEASMIVKNGTLRRGDRIQTDCAQGNIKILEDFLGNVVGELTPSAPAIVIGFDVLPEIGENFWTGDGLPAEGSRQTVAADGGGMTTRKIGGGSANGGELNLLLKASDAGSLEVLTSVIGAVGDRDEKGISVIDRSVGNITDSDVRTALATGAAIIGFKNRAEKGARNLAEAQGVSVIVSDIVYELADAVTEFLAGKRGPQAVGKLEVLALFNQEKSEKQLIGGRVLEGVIRGKATCEIVRKTDGGAEVSMGSGRILGLREKKDQLTQAEKGREIGVLLSTGILIEVGDILVVKK
jgi:translation initiation factor IF-2